MREPDKRTERKAPQWRNIERERDREIAAAGGVQPRRERVEGDLPDLSLQEKAVDKKCLSRIMGFIVTAAQLIHFSFLFIRSF